MPTKDKQRISPSQGCPYECELLEGEKWEGVICASCEVDVYFVDHANFTAWLTGQPFNHECCTKSSFNAKIEFLAPKEGTWFLIIENNGNEAATIELLVQVSSQ